MADRAHCSIVCRIEWVTLHTELGTVDGNVNNQVNNRHLLPPTPGELEKLVKKLRKMQLPPVQDEATQANYHSLHRRLSPEDIQTLAKRYRAKESISSLSREYGISRPSLRSLLREAGVSPRRDRMTPKQADKAIKLYESGLTIMEVVAKVGFSYGVVNRMLHSRGVNVRPRRNQG